MPPQSSVENPGTCTHGPQGLARGQALDLGDLSRLQGREVGEVEPEAVLVHHAARLLYVGAEHLAQGGVEQVGGRVVGPHAAAADGVDQGVDRGVLHQRAGHLDLVEMPLLGRRGAVQHFRVAALETQLARVTHLAAGLGVEGRAVQQHVAFAAELLDALVLRIEERHHVSLALEVVVAREAGGGEIRQHRQVASEAQVMGLHGRPGPSPLGGQFLLEARQVGGDAAFPAPVLHQVHRESIGVVQAEDVAAGQGAGRDVAGLEELQARGEGLAELLLFAVEGFLDAAHLGEQLGVLVAHGLEDGRRQVGEEQPFDAQLAAEAEGAAHDLAQHVAAAFVAGHDAVVAHEGGGADVVGDHLGGGTVGVLAAVFRVDLRRLPDGVEDGLEEVDLVVGVHALEDAGRALQAHAGVDAGLGQGGEHALGVALVLHEDQVPDLHDPVALAIGRGVAGQVGAAVEVHLRAGAAGACVAHLPEVVFFPEAHDAVGPHTGGLPHLLGLRVGGHPVGALEHGDPELVGIQGQAALVQRARDELPGEADGVGLEVVAEAEVAEHLEESVMARGEADLIQVVVLAAGAQALLAGGGAAVVPVLLAEEHILELDHARVRPHHRGIVGGADDRARGHPAVSLTLEVVEEGLTQF
ncbi:MAG: hypothetical protein H6P99_3130 [Holophagaceae bacterium]|nr:hypothetical protein [Holophagaceae bacterium]